MMSQTFTFKLTSEDRQMLDQLAAVEGENASVLIRQLIRKSARERGIWAPAENIRPQGTAEVDREHV
jgi:predicted transcriptional regulator